MPRGVSIHIGVNRPAGGHPPLRYSEAAAWRMAALAVQAGYGSVALLRGEAATRAAVRDAIARGADSLAAGDTLLVTFSGHGSRMRDTNGDDHDRCDEAWCLSDDALPDDCVKECWQRFRPGVRIVLVLECCYSAGAARVDYDEFFFGTCVPAYRPPLVYRGGSGWRGEEPQPASPCVEPPRDTDGIQASILLLAASGEAQPAQDGVFSNHLLHAWKDGVFRGSYCELIQEVQQRVQGEGAGQEPQIRMLGAPKPEFSLASAFHLNPVEIVYR